MLRTNWYLITALFVESKVDTLNKWIQCQNMQQQSMAGEIFWQPEPPVSGTWEVWREGWGLWRWVAGADNEWHTWHLAWSCIPCNPSQCVCHDITQLFWGSLAHHHYKPSTAEHRDSYTSTSQQQQSNRKYSNKHKIWCKSTRQPASADPGSHPVSWSWGSTFQWSQIPSA